MASKNPIHTQGTGARLVTRRQSKEKIQWVKIFGKDFMIKSDMEKFKEWHLYKGCSMTTPYGVCKFLYLKEGIDESIYNPVVVDRGDQQFAFLRNEVKFILRRLNSMTEAEQREEYLLTRFCEGDRDVLGRQGMARGFRYLLSREFDLFGLIDSGEAIDVAIITENAGK